MSFDESAPIVTSLADGKTGKFNYLSANPFEFRHILQSHPPPPQQILQGELQMPTRRQPGFEHKPVPCVVGMHGSWGWGPHHIQHLENLRANGFATFKCDSFLSRGVASTSERQLACTMSNLQHDSYAALNLLATHPGIDSSRIGCTGWSLGGGAAVYNALDAIGNRLGGPFGVRFASHLGFYPAAHYRPRGNWKWAQVPIGIIQGELDDYSPTFMCKDLVNHALKQGARMALHIYPNAHHSFDRGNSMPVEFLPKVSKPTGTLDLQWPDGTLHVTGEPAGTAPATEYEERRKNGWKYCDRGAHAGGNAIETANAMRDTVEFFKQTLMGDAVLSHQFLPLMIKTEVTELQPPPGSAKL